MEYRKRSEGVIVDNTIDMNNKSPEEIAAEMFPYFKHKMTVEYTANQHTDELRAAWVLGFNYLLSANGVLQRENQKLREDLLNAVRIKQALAIGREQSKWISVEDRLPEEEQMVLIFRDTNDGIIEATMWDKQEEKYYKMNSITHWQPLPSPPKTDKP